MITSRIWKKDGYQIRSAHAEDAEEYYSQNFCPLDPEAARLTGSRSSYSREEVVSFLRSAVEAEDRYHFFIVAPDGRIIGESVINEIDLQLRCANFRIIIFQNTERGRGIGTWAVETARDFAFEELGLHRLELDVFSFNPRARKVYLKAGFRQEGLRRDAVRDGNRYGDDIIMAILEDEWRQLKRQSHS